MKTEVINLNKIRLNGSNPRHITDEKFNSLLTSILSFPKMLELRPIVLDTNMEALGGNMRFRALTHIVKMTPDAIEKMLLETSKYQKMTEVERQLILSHWVSFQNKPTATVMHANDLSDDEQKEFIIKDNVGFGEWDWDMLANEWNEALLTEWGLDVWQPEEDATGAGTGTGSEEEAHGKLTERFVVPPFTVLDTRQGYWLERKRLWKTLIKDNGESREDTLANGGMMSALNNGVSILDPVLAEIVNLWFGIEGGKTFDCFAGDSVFGYVSAYLGNEFTGVEIRPEQAQLNNDRVTGMKANYINDDGQNVALHVAPDSQDLLFSCPPYFDLEVYSDLPNDASNQDSYEDFIKILDNAFTSALTCLKENRFAVVVVGDVRDKKTGFYYRFHDDIKDIFKRNGALLYNDMILVESIGTLPQRVGRFMEHRKIGKCHQNILVFYKGDTHNIKNYFKKIDYDSKDLESFGMVENNEPGTN